MKRKQVYSLISDGLIFVLSIILLFIPFTGFDDINLLFFIFMLFYSLITFMLYILTRRKDDYEYLFITLASVLAASSAVCFDLENPHMVIPFSLIGWISMVAVIKLIKMDYYHDRNNILWFLRCITFVLFLIIGTVTCVNLFYNTSTQIIMLGFFFMICSILESFEPLVEYVVAKKRLSLKINNETETKMKTKTKTHKKM